MDKKYHYIIAFSIFFTCINIAATIVISILASEYNKSVTYQLTPSDVIWLNESISSTFCSGITISTDSKTNFQVYTANKPLVDYDLNDEIYSMGINSTLSSLSSRLYRFFLLEGSLIDITGCSKDINVQLRMFRNSTRSSGCKVSKRCPSKNVKDFKFKKCPKTSNVEKNIGTNSFLYLSFQNMDRRLGILNFTVTLHRVVYNLNEMELKCNSFDNCDVPLEPKEYIVLNIPAKKSNSIAGNDISVTTKCLLNTSAFVGYYFLIVIAALFMGGLALFMSKLKKEKVMKDIYFPLLAK